MTHFLKKPLSSDRVWLPHYFFMLPSQGERDFPADDWILKTPLQRQVEEGFISERNHNVLGLLDKFVEKHGQFHIRDIFNHPEVLHHFNSSSIPFVDKKGLARP